MTSYFSENGPRNRKIEFSLLVDKDETWALSVSLTEDNDDGTTILDMFTENPEEFFKDVAAAQDEWERVKNT